MFNLTEVVWLNLEKGGYRCCKSLSMLSSVQTSHSCSNIYIHAKRIHRKNTYLSLAQIAAPMPATANHVSWSISFGCGGYTVCLDPRGTRLNWPMDTLKCIHETTQDVGNATDQFSRNAMTKYHRLGIVSSSPPLSRSCNLEFQSQSWQMIPSGGCEGRT